jgi:molecular chaperone GrpE
MQNKDKRVGGSIPTDEPQAPGTAAEGNNPTDELQAEAAEGHEGEAPAALSIEELQELLQLKEAEAKANEEKFLRQAAELENYKKRVAREKEDAIKFANEALVRDLLPVLDNLERAVDHARSGGNGKPLLDGIEMVLQTWLEALGKHGVTRITAKGDVFDPEKHEAYAQVETDEFPANTIVDEVHGGYFLRDRLLRPSLVSVAKPSEKKEKPEEEG